MLTRLQLELDLVLILIFKPLERTNQKEKDQKEAVEFREESIPFPPNDKVVATAAKMKHPGIRESEGCRAKT